MNRGMWRWLVPLALTLAAACGRDAAGASAANSPIIIGAAIGQTGFIVPYDVPALTAAQIAVDEINKSGGLLGHPLQIVYSDTHSDRAQGANAAITVIGKGAKMVIVSCDYDFGSGAAFVAQSKGLISFSTCAASPKFGVQGVGSLAFTMGTATTEQGPVVAEWAYKSRHYHSVYILNDPTVEYDKTLSHYFQESWTRLAGKGSIVGLDTFQNSDASIASQITRLKGVSRKPDFIFLASYPPGAASALHQLRAAGITTPVLASESMDGNYWLPAVPHLSNFYYATYASVYGNDPHAAINRLVREYKARTGKDLPAGHALTGYSLIEAYARAVRMAGTTDSQAVKRALESFRDVPLTIGSTTFTPDLHINIHRSMAILQVQDGKIGYLTTWMPAWVPKVEF